jgi:hypothetical protein
MLRRILDSSPYLIGLFFLMQSANRASYDTLTAVDTRSISHGDIVSRTNRCVESTIEEGKNTNTLLLTSRYATTALNALAAITNNGERLVIIYGRALYAFKSNLTDTIFFSKSLKFAVLVTDTGQAVTVMIGKDHLESSLTGITNFLGICMNDHTFAYRHNAGSSKSTGLLYFNEADAACANFVDIF